MNEPKQCECGKAISRKAVRCHGCANRRQRPGRRTMDLDLPVGEYSRLSAVVRNAIARCTDSDHSGWRRYGGRGITVYSTWVRNPAAFVQYLLTLPGHDDPSLVIDRRNNSEGYVPGNVQFVTRSVSLRNRDPYGVPLPLAGDKYDALTVIQIDGDEALCRCDCGREVLRKSRGIRFTRTYLQCQSCANRHSWRTEKQPTSRPRRRGGKTS